MAVNVEEIQWSDGPPPPVRSVRPKSKWARIIEQLETKPGVWATFHYDNYESGRSIPTQLKKQYPDADLETTIRKTDAGGCDLWIRIKPDEATS